VYCPVLALAWLERERIDNPEPGSDRIRVEAFGHLRRHLGNVCAEGVQRGLGIINPRLGPQIVGDDAGLARLNLPQCLEAEI
jgi:hypothetical protein